MSHPESFKSQKLSAVRDLAISWHRVALMAEAILPEQARQVFNARGKIVTPGLDIHVHVDDDVAPLRIRPDPNCIAKGVSKLRGWRP